MIESPFFGKAFRVSTSAERVFIRDLKRVRVGTQKTNTKSLLCTLYKLSRSTTVNILRLPSRPKKPNDRYDQYKTPEIQVWALKNYNMNNFNKYQLYALRELTTRTKI